MSFTVPHTAPDGRRMMIEGDVLAISRRMQEGDPSVGWVGDPNLSLDLDTIRGVFIVVRHDPATGRTSDVMSYPPPLDAGLLIQLREADTWRAGNDPFARMDAEHDRQERSGDEVFADFVHEEVSPRMLHALRQAGVPDLPSKPVHFSGAFDEGESR